MSRSRLVGGISIGGPLRPTATPPPPPSRAILQLPRGTKPRARARCSPNGGGHSPRVPRVIYPRAASRMRKGSVRKSFRSPSSSLETVARNSRCPVYRGSWIVARPHTRAALSAVHRGRYVSGKRQGGGLFDARIYPRRAYFRPAFPFRIFMNICANVRRVLSLSLSLSICLSLSAFCPFV